MYNREENQNAVPYKLLTNDEPTNKMNRCICYKEMGSSMNMFTATA